MAEPGSDEQGNGAGSDIGMPAPAKPRRSRPKTARAAKAIAKAEALSAAGAEALTELDRLRRSVDQLVHGLQAMVETQATHTEMIRRLLAAATAPSDPEHHVARQLEQVVDLLVSQGAQMRTIGSTLKVLPAEVGSAVARQVTAALALVR